MGILLTICDSSEEFQAFHCFLFISYFSYLYLYDELNDLFDQISSTPLSAAKRLQFSLDVEPVHDMPIMSKLRTVVIPLFWIEESVHLNSTYTSIFRNLYVYVKCVIFPFSNHSLSLLFFIRSFFTLNSIIKYVGIALGICGLIIIVLSAFAGEANNKKLKTIQPSTNSTESTAAVAEMEKSELQKERY